MWPSHGPYRMWWQQQGVAFYRRSLGLKSLGGETTTVDDAWLNLPAVRAAVMTSFCCVFSSHLDHQTTSLGRASPLSPSQGAGSYSLFTSLGALLGFSELSSLASTGMAAMSWSTQQHISCDRVHGATGWLPSWKSSLVDDHPPWVNVSCDWGYISETKFQVGWITHNFVSKCSCPNFCTATPASFPHPVHPHTVVLLTQEILLQETMWATDTSHQVANGRRVNCPWSLGSSLLLQFS